MVKKNKTSENSSKIAIFVVIGICVALIIGVVVWAIINNNKGTGAEGNGGETSSLNVELNGNADVAVQLGDYDAMSTLAHDIQNGKMTGKVVAIKGTVSHPGKSYSVVQANESGSQKIGTVFTIQDGEEADYPKEGAKIRIEAKVVEVSPMNFQLVTTKDHIAEIQ